MSAALRPWPWPWPPERERPRPPRRRFFFDDSPDFSCCWAAGATGAGRVSPICGLRTGGGGMVGRGTDGAEVSGPVAGADAGDGCDAFTSAAPSVPGFLRFFPPREPRRRFLFPPCGGRGAEPASPCDDRVWSAAGVPAEPLFSMKFSSLTSRTERAMGPGGCLHGASGPFGPEGQDTRRDYRKRRMCTLWTSPIITAKAIVWDPP